MISMYNTSVLSFWFVFSFVTNISVTSPLYRIDIPIHLVYGTDDRVIPAECILQHYDALHKVHPELVYLKRFDNVGHLDVVYGNDENVIQYVLQSIQQ